MPVVGIMPKCNCEIESVYEFHGVIIARLAYLGPGDTP